ncbi:MAG: tyrosine-type recombinase/integrase [Anaerolineae bacterium]|nr:tyrosine-type recombinase/integrase [Anaerolineae bacterium]
MTTLPEIHITSDTTLLPAIQSWEVYLQDQGRSRFTIKAFIGDLNLFASFFAPDTTLGSVTERDINRFLEWLQKERGVPCSPKSLSRRITSIKSFFRWLTQTGRLPIDPAEKVLQQSVISPLPQVLTPDEELKVIEAATAQHNSSKKDPRSYILITLLLSSGIKKGECLSLNMNHLDLEDPKNASFYVRYAGTANRYKERKIDLTQDWVEVFPEYVAKYAPIEQVFPWSPRRLEYLLEDLGREAGLDKHLSFDMCRWTSAINDWQSGMEKDLLRQKLGISKIQWREISMKLRQLSGEN